MKQKKKKKKTNKNKKNKNKKNIDNYNKDKCGGGGVHTHSMLRQPCAGIAIVNDSAPKGIKRVVCFFFPP